MDLNESRKFLKEECNNDYFLLFIKTFGPIIKKPDLSGRYPRPVLSNLTIGSVYSKNNFFEFNHKFSSWISYFPTIINFNSSDCSFDFKLDLKDKKSLSEYLKSLDKNIKTLFIKTYSVKLSKFNVSKLLFIELFTTGDIKTSFLDLITNELTKDFPEERYDVLRNEIIKGFIKFKNDKKINESNNIEFLKHFILLLNDNPEHVIKEITDSFKDAVKKMYNGVSDAKGFVSDYFKSSEPKKFNEISKKLNNIPIFLPSNMEIFKGTIAWWDGTCISIYPDEIITVHKNNLNNKLIISYLIHEYVHSIQDICLKDFDSLQNDLSDLFDDFDGFIEKHKINAAFDKISYKLFKQSIIFNSTSQKLISSDDKKLESELNAILNELLDCWKTLTIFFEYSAEFISNIYLRDNKVRCIYYTEFFDEKKLDINEFNKRDFYYVNILSRINEAKLKLSKLTLSLKKY